MVSCDICSLLHGGGGESDGRETDPEVYRPGKLLSPERRRDFARDLLNALSDGIAMALAKLSAGDSPFTACLPCHPISSARVMKKSLKTLSWILVKYLLLRFMHFFIGSAPHSNCLREGPAASFRRSGRVNEEAFTA